MDGNCGQPQSAAWCSRLRMPKLRTGSFFPSLLERGRRVDQWLYAR